MGELEPPGLGVEYRLVMSRQFYCEAFALLLAAEVSIALFVHDAFVQPYLGDVLVIMLLYCFFRGPIGCKGKLIVAIVTALGFLAEILQYFCLADRLGLDASSSLRIILGSTFDWIDLLCYLVGGLALTLWENKKERNKNDSSLTLSEKKRLQK